MQMDGSAEGACFVFGVSFASMLTRFLNPAIFCVTCQCRGVEKLWETCGQTVLPARLSPPFLVENLDPASSLGGFVAPLCIGELFSRPYHASALAFSFQSSLAKRSLCD